jgi:membrane-associated protease RseP (regulator of RpoE activity)
MGVGDIGVGAFDPPRKIGADEQIEDAVDAVGGDAAALLVRDGFGDVVGAGGTIEAGESFETPEHRRAFDISSDVAQGMVVTGIDPRSAAARAGLRPGDVLLEVNRAPVATPKQLQDAYARAKGNVLLLIIGLGISIPLIVYGSTLVLKLMTRYPIIVTIGGGVMGWVAGEMFVTDPAMGPWVDTNALWLHESAPGRAAVFVVIAGKAAANERIAAAWKVLQGTPLPQEEPAPPGYRWAHRRWRTLPDGTRDYAAYHGKESFRVQLPISSRIRSPRRR